jgi:hypothetical protein
VLPGRINLESKSYLTLDDDCPLNSRQEISPVSAQVRSTKCNLTLNLKVKEALNALRYLLEASQKGGEKSSVPLLVRVKKLDDMLVNARG